MTEQHEPTELERAINTQVKQAMNEWTKETLFTEENMQIFWSSAFDVLQSKAQTHTGKFVFSSLSGILRNLLLFVLIGSLVYAFGGWTALATFAKSVLPHGGT